jgi:hexosaminidase
MIDTSRHFLSVAQIKRAVDAMAASKLNDLHWHITDDQSFPLCLEAHPQLCQLSAYRSRTTGLLMTSVVF